MRELDEGQVEELTGGGECHLHYHPSVASHEDLERLQAAHRIVEVTTNYDVSPADDIILANTNAGNVTVTLPPSKGQREYIISKAASLNTLTIEFSGTESCYGQTSIAVVTLGEAKRFKAYLGNWITI